MLFCMMQSLKCCLFASCESSSCLYWHVNVYVNFGNLAGVTGNERFIFLGIDIFIIESNFV